ncbi:MAG: hypothetical protein ABIG71_03825 [Candidatus Uhrbacteria bacterium]
MNAIRFPIRHRGDLASGKRCITIRYGSELGRFTTGSMYSAVSYAGNGLDLSVHVKAVRRTTAGKLSGYGIARRGVEALLERSNVTVETPVDVIRFTTRNLGS